MWLYYQATDPTSPDAFTEPVLGAPTPVQRAWVGERFDLLRTCGSDDA